MGAYPSLLFKHPAVQAYLITSFYDRLIEAKTVEETLSALTPYLDAFDGLFGPHLGSKEDFVRIALQYSQGGPKQPLIDAAYLVGAKVAALGLGAALNLICARQEELNLPVGVRFIPAPYRECFLRPYCVASSVIALIRRPPQNVSISCLSELVDSRFTNTLHSTAADYLRQPMAETTFDLTHEVDIIAPLADDLIVFCYHTFYQGGNQ